MKVSEFELSRFDRGQKSTVSLDVVSMPCGMLTFPTLVARGRQDGKTLLAIAGVHGDEFEGPKAIMDVFAQLRPEEMRGTFVGIPVVNAPAWDAGTRMSPIDGLNLARVFPGDAGGSVSQRIAHALTEYLFPKADLMLDLHSAGVQYVLPTLAGGCTVGGEMGRIIREACFAFGAEVIWNSPPNQGRSLSGALLKGIPAIYTETTGGGQARPEDVEALVTGTLNVMKYLGILEGQPQTRKITHLINQPETARDFDRAINAREAGFFTPLLPPLTPVKQGDLLGVTTDLFGTVVEEARADQDGLLISIRTFPRVFAGVLLAIVVSGVRTSQ